MAALPESLPALKAPAREAVFKWFLEGHSIPEIRQAIETIYPDAKPDHLLRHAAEQFARLAEEPADAVKGFCIATTRDLYRKTLEVGDFAGALKAIKLLNDLASHPTDRRQRAIDCATITADFTK